jgi:hypothetical protein
VTKGPCPTATERMNHMPSAVASPPTTTTHDSTSFATPTVVIMGGPNRSSFVSPLNQKVFVLSMGLSIPVEIFKFGFYLFLCVLLPLPYRLPWSRTDKLSFSPIAVMAHFSDPEWYKMHVAPVRFSVAALNSLGPTRSFDFP